MPAQHSLNFFLTWPYMDHTSSYVIIITSAAARPFEQSIRTLWDLSLSYVQCSARALILGPIVPLTKIVYLTLFARTCNVEQLTRRKITDDMKIINIVN